MTGSSSGIGFETSVLLARNGFHTYSTVRNLEKSQALTNIAKKEDLPLQVIELDVSSDKSVRDGVNGVLHENKRIDVIVNNAGYALVGAFEDLSMDEIKAQFETNFFGAIRVIQAVLPTMRDHRNGRIVNVSSMGGKIAIPLDSAYHGTKFALEGLSESLQYEVEQFGIKIILIEPGAIKSNFFNNLKMASKAQRPDSPYTQMMQKLNAGFSFILENAPSPVEVAKVIVMAATSENPELRYAVGDDATAMLEAKRTMSDAEFGNLMKKQFLSH
ncbi:MAG TPA: SDR family oxidoreductase [Methylomirabilota bacterium]|nr:SDR family oxidoreductase [Candidatus Acidoferrum sp.]HYT44173.1 SDR family oxidoreductase [Methylomirabilota bacterium]